jgi:hypothetical protein
MTIPKRDLQLFAIVGIATLINEFGISSGLVFLTLPIALLGSLFFLLKIFPQK